jgi:hypothetical protein
MSQRIQQLNDAFRRTGDGGRVIFTAGVSDLGVAFSHQALALVRRFDVFTPDNDPHGEHDFGSFTLDGRKLFWKIDYYDAACQYGLSALLGHRYPTSWTKHERASLAGSPLALQQLRGVGLQTAPWG